MTPPRGALAVATALLGCGGCKDEAPRHALEAGTPVATVTTAPAPTPTREPEVPVVPVALSDASAGACAVLTPPTSVGRGGPFSLVVRAPGAFEAWVRDGAVPRLAATLDATGHVTATGMSGARHAPGCVAAAGRAFCAGPDGRVHRYLLAADGAKPEGAERSARAGTELAATAVAGHAAVAFLRDHTTSEGNVTEAFLAAEDGPEQRLSEDGTGATSVALVPRAEGALAVYIDARRAMCPIHARTIQWAGDKPAIGPDVVLYVAGSAESFTHVLLGGHDQAAYVLLPIAHDLSFGLGVVKVEGEPRMDAPVVWSDYPNGIDPAPVAATYGTAPLRVARVRPSAPKYGSPRVLEIGRIEADGAFTAYVVLPTQGAAVDVAIVNDGASTVIAYTDAAGGWMERIRCP